MLLINRFKVSELSGLFCLPEGTQSDFSCLGGQKKLLGLWFVREDQYPGWHYDMHMHTFYIVLKRPTMLYEDVKVIICNSHEKIN